MFQYTDDWLLIYHNQDTDCDVILKFVDLCVKLGLLINFDKSEVISTQDSEHLVIWWCLRTAWMFHTERKVARLQLILGSVLKAVRAPFILLEIFRDTFGSLEELVPFGHINFRYLQWQVTLS